MGLIFKIEDKDYIIEDEHVTLKTIRKSSIFRGVFYRMSPKIEAIGEDCFAYSSLRHIALSPNLKLIAPYAFAKSGSLKEISLPKGLLEIRDYAFYDCQELKKIEIPNIVKEIGISCFSGCENLEHIDLPKNLKVISEGLFFRCINLQTVTIPEEVDFINENAFASCISLKSLTIPSTAKIRCDFSTCTYLEKVIVTYKDFTDLYSFFKKNHMLINRTISTHSVLDVLGNHLTNRTTALILKGKELSEEEKNKISKIIDKDNQEYIIYEEEKTKPQDNTEDKEIKEKVDEITKICENLDETNRKIIITRINKLLDDYKQNLELLKPKLKEETELKFGKKDITTLKPQLLSDLELIKLSLAREQSLIQKISDISKYKEYLNMDIKKLEKEDSNLENMIKNIVYYCKFLPDDKRESYLDRLKNIIDKTLELASNEFENILKDKIPLNNQIDYELELRKELNTIYDEVANTAEKRKPFKELLDKVLSAREVTEFIDNNDIKNLFNNIEYVINKLSESKYKEELKNKFITKKKNYIYLLNDILHDEKKLRSITIEDMEKEIREDIQSLLDEINKYAYLDKYEGEYIKDGNLIEQLDNSLDIIKEGKVNLDNKEERHDIVTIYVSEIINKLKGLDKEIHEEIKKELLDIINKHKLELTNKKIEDLKEYNKVTLKILKDLSDIDFELDSYIKRIEEYSQYRK